MSQATPKNSMRFQMDMRRRGAVACREVFSEVSAVPSAAFGEMGWLAMFF